MEADQYNTKNGEDEITMLGGLDFNLNEYFTDALEKEIADDVSGGVEIKKRYIAKDEKVPTKYYELEKPVDIDSKLHVDDMKALLYSEMRRKGIAGHHINSMNTFYKIGIKQIITQLFKAEVNRMKNDRDKTEEDKEIEFISFNVEFINVNLKPPSSIKYLSRKPQMLTPNTARLKNLTYSAQLFVDAKITATAFYRNGKIKVREELLNDFRIASIPVMTRTDLCNTSNCSADTLRELQEDPLNPGGCFIIKGGEWCVDNLENILINGFQVYKNMHQNEVARGDFISKPGDAYENSFRILLRYLNNGGITLEIQTNKYDKLEIPFFLIFRAFGMTRDRDIIDNIAYGRNNDDPITVHIVEVLERAFQSVDEKMWGPVKNSTDANEIILYIAQRMNEFANGSNYKKDENAVKYLTTSTFTTLDKFIFPHIGLDVNSRIQKLRFLGHLLHKLLRVEMEVLESTDRDNYKNKRVHTAGVSLAKTFKTQFNFSIIQEIKKHLIKAFKSTSFSQVNLVESVKAAVNPADLERVLVQSITTGNKTLTIKRNEITNRVSSQQLYQKNDVHVKSTLNTINTTNSSAAKQNERADEMRRVHPSTIGFVCVCQSADTGEKVGTSKQMAISASICEASSSYALKDILLHDEKVIDLEDIEPPMITSRGLNKIFVNGDWIGFCENGHELVRQYRNARRFGDIHKFTTIVWEEALHEVYFWVDVGRLIRPLVIVYNNADEFVETYRKAFAGDAKARESIKTLKFRQWVKLTRSHINLLRSGKISVETLRKERVIEYIAPEEQLNAYLAPNLEVLREEEFNMLKQFTHMDIDQSIFGLVALSAPSANHTGPVRTTMFTNQKKQTCGWHALNWPFRIDKNTFLQYYCDRPITPTFADSLTYPNGQNAIVAIQIYSGYNQEDSTQFNRAAIDRGLFNGSHFHYEKAELEKGEVFGNIDFSRTMDVKKDAIYEYIEDGFIKEGTIVHKGYVLISKYMKIPKPTDEFLYVDRSVIYKFDEPSIVERVITPRNDDDAVVAKVKLRSLRNIQVGDKISSRAGNKGICALITPACDMPYSEDGIIPDVIINPACVPTRMCLGQLIETVMSEYAMETGGLLDSTTFKKNDVRSMIDWLAKNTDNKYGCHRRLYNGKTGNWIDALIFMGNNYYNRLMKFVADESYSVNSGPTSALTRQPLDGKTNNGGLRLGEMEKDVLIGSHGIGRSFSEKFYKDSDGIKIPICRLCGNRAVVNEKRGIYKCKQCKDNADIAFVDSAWVANLLFHEIQAMGIKVDLGLEPYSYTEHEK